MSAPGALLRRGVDALVRRVVRLRPDRIPGEVLPWVIACWIATLTLAGVILSPVIGGVTGAGSDALAEFVSLLFETWFRVLITGSLAIAAGAAVTAVVLARRQVLPRPLPARWRFEAVVGAGVLPVLFLVGDRSWVFAIAGAGLLIAAEVLARVGRLPASVVGLLGSGPWLAFAADQIWGDGIGQEGFSWFAVIAIGAAAVSVLGFYGFTRAADSRVRLLRFLYRDDLPRGAVLAIVGVMAALVTLRIAVFPDLFDDDQDATLWSPLNRSSILSWILAGALAAFVIVLALRSSRRPFRRYGERGVAATFSVLGNRDLLLVGLGFVVYLVILGVIPDPNREIFATLFDLALDLVPAVALLSLIIAGLVVVLPRFRGSAARWYTLVSVAYLLPPSIAFALDTQGVVLPEAIADFTATPVQITVLLLVAAMVFALVNLGLRPERRINPSAIVRMAVVPFLAFHIGRIVPELWSGSGRWLVAIGALAALVFFMPKAAADRQRHGINVLRASALQVFALTGYLIATSGFAGDLVLFTVLWLSITIFAALTVDTGDDPVIPSPAPQQESARDEDASATITRLPSDGRG